MCCKILIFILAFYTDLLLLSWFLFIRSYYIRTDDLYLERSNVENVLFDTRSFSCFGCMVDYEVMLGYVLYPAVAIANTNQTEAVRQEDYLNMNFDYLLDPKGAIAYSPGIFEFLAKNRTARHNITSLEQKYMDDYMQMIMDDFTMQDREEKTGLKPPTLVERKVKVRRSANLDERTTSYLFHRSSLTKSDMNKILDAEFNPYMDRFDFQLNWFFRLFLTKKSDARMKIACICENNFYDIEDDFSTSLISHDLTNRDCREFALYLDDVKKKLTKETKSGRVKLYLKNALWCDNKLTSDYPIRRLNEYVVQILVRQLHYLITMESNMVFERYRVWRLIQIVKEPFLEDTTTQLPAVTEKLTDE